MMRCPGLRELTNLVDAREEQLLQLLPAWWPAEKKQAAIKGEIGRTLIHSVVAIVYMELKHIEATE